MTPTCMHNKYNTLDRIASYSMTITFFLFHLRANNSCSDGACCGYLGPFDSGSGISCLLWYAFLVFIFSPLDANLDYYGN
ncbi:hypothetical protein F5Y16DRAFT_358810 [Xylariaceae sp. FL0255]|nr:hypothetical protein F5Y16DRAFT_358810 [Xylariaceae sp. FL0255]